MENVSSIGFVLVFAHELDVILFFFLNILHLEFFCSFLFLYSYSTYFDFVLRTK